MNNADSGVVSLKLKGKTTGTLSLEMEMHTKILPAVDIRDVWKESKRLRATPFTLTTVNATEEEDLPSLFDFKNLREVFALNYFEGDLTTRFQVTLPANARAGSIIHDVGGVKGVSIKCPALTRSPIINVLVPTFILSGVPEVKALDFVDKSYHGVGKPFRVPVDLKNTDWQPGQKVDIKSLVGTLGKSKVLSFVCPKFDPKSNSKVVMVIVNRDEEYFGAQALTHTDRSAGDNGGADGDFHMDHGLEAADGGNKIRWEDSPLKKK